MKDIDNEFLIDDIFGSKEQSTENFESDTTLQDEIEDVSNICDNDQKLEYQ
ncbi:MAG: hypothetical protein Q9M43_15860 [Sulfurimonas sp.]|nr:hypothetical protein [Sulfurimonas sp.]